MNKSLVLGIGIAFAFTVAILWAYLLIFGANTSSQIVNSIFGEVPETERTVLQTNGKETVDIDKNTVNQLTTRPVAGFAFEEENGGAIYYVERGTGHVYRISLSSGVEDRVMANTNSGVVGAVFSTDLSQVNLTFEEGGTNKHSVVSLQDGSSVLYTLPNNSTSVDFIGTSTVAFVKQTSNGSEGVAVNVVTGEESVLWKTEFSDITVDWGFGVIPTYVANRPAPYLKGAVFEVANQKLKLITTPDFSKTFLTGNKNIIGITSAFSVAEKTNVSKTIATSTSLSFPLTIIPEKCAFDTITNNIVWCGYDYTDKDINSRTYITDWYKGKKKPNDMIWVTNINEEAATIEVDLPALTGQTIDVIDLTVSKDGQWLFFINKNNDTLWSYKVR